MINSVDSGVQGRNTKGIAAKGEGVQYFRTLLTFFFFGQSGSSVFLVVLDFHFTHGVEAFHHPGNTYLM